MLKYSKAYLWIITGNDRCQGNVVAAEKNLIIRYYKAISGNINENETANTLEMV